MKNYAALLECEFFFNIGVNYLRASDILSVSSEEFIVIFIWMLYECFI